MNVRNEIKAQIIRAGMTMQEVVDLLSDEYGWSPARMICAFISLRIFILIKSSIIQFMCRCNLCAPRWSGCTEQ